MSTRDDVGKLYDKSNNFDKIKKVLFIINIGIPIALFFSSGIVKDIMGTFGIILGSAYLLLSSINDGIIWYDAEKERRKNNIQNAFEVRLSENETDGYYNNKIPPSAMKYVVNQFESLFFTKNIGQQMLAKSIAKSIIVVVIAIISFRYIRDYEMLNIIIQSLFSISIIVETINLILFVCRINKLYDEMYSLLVTIGATTENNSTSNVLLLSYVLEYEVIKAYYKIHLDSKIFNKMNDELSKEWLTICDKI